MTIVSKSQLAVALNVSRPRISQYCERGMPVRNDGKIDFEPACHWIGQNHVSLNTNKGAGRAARLVAGKPRAASKIPPGYGVMGAQRNPFDQGALFAAREIAARVGPLGAVAAVESGASCRVAHALSGLLMVMVMQEVVEVFSRCGVEPFASKRDPSVWMMDDSPITPNWAKLAQTAGEPVDLPAWEEFTAEMRARMNTGQPVACPDSVQR